MVQRSGDAFEINSTTAEIQDQPATASLDNGGFVAAWRDTSGRGTGVSDDVRVQVFDGTGTPLGREIRANTTTEAAQDAPSVAGLKGGGFVVAWADGSVVTPDSNSISDITGQMFASDGTRLGGEFRVNTTTDVSQQAPDLAPLADGGFLATWSDVSPGGSGDFGRVKGQIFSPSGQKEGGEIVLNTTTQGVQSGPVSAGLPDGGFVAVWEDQSNTGADTSNGALRGQVFHADGSPEGSEFLVNTTTFDRQDNPAVTGLNDGRFVVTWDGPVGDDDAAVGQVFAGDGSKQGGEFVVADDTDFDQGNPAVAPRPDGGFLVAFEDGDGGRLFDEFQEITARAFGADGSPDTGDVLVNDPLGGRQTDPVMTALADGDYAAVWVDDGGHGADASETAIRGQVLSGDAGTSQPDGSTFNILDLTPAQQIAAVYVAYYGRAPEQAGLDFWRGEYDKGVNTDGKTAAQALDDIAESFRTVVSFPTSDSENTEGVTFDFFQSPETATRADVADFVRDVYDNLFGRAPNGTPNDTNTGLGYWTQTILERLDNSEPVGDALINIASGAQDDDISVLENRIESGLAFSRAFSLTDGAAFDLAEDRSAAVQAVASVDKTASSVSSAIQAAQAAAAQDATAPALTGTSTDMPDLM